VSVDSVDGAARVVVADSSPGIPFDERQRVFERFWRGSAATDVSGRGIGLAVAAEIVHAHGGRIDVDTSNAGGAGLTVTLSA